jgi:vacuolar-type H+-ATPase subunit E/Vma4
MSDAKLLDGIHRDAEEEAARIMDQAEQQARTKQAGLNEKLELVSREAEAEREKRLSGIKRRLDSDLRTRRRRESLKAREHYYNLIISRALSRLKALTADNKDYREVLAKWIAEGIVGLRQTEVSVTASVQDRLDAAILQRAAELAGGVLGQTPVIRQGQQELAEQGVAVFSVDGRVSFFNQISNRFRRYDSEIKQIIYQGLEKQDVNDV